MHVVPPLAHDGDDDRRISDALRRDAMTPGTVEGQQPASFTVDELAAAAGLPVRTVRHYQSEKVLPPPQRRGRIAVYGQEHLDRLVLIGRLQDRGLRLAAIRDVFKRVEKGEVWLDDWLGLGDELRAPWSEERPAVLTEEELAERVGGRPGAVAALVDAGLVRRQHGLTSTYLVPSPGLLDITLQLDAAGVDVDTAAAAAGTIRKHLRRASGDLVDFFLERAGAGFARRGSTEDITEALGALRPLGARAVQLVFIQEIERALRHAVEQGRATPAPPSPETAERAASHSDREQTGATP
jgi:DNA-binding transcriptional MerR regulator